MAHWSLGHRLPVVNKPLYGDRERFGLVAKPDDPSWIEWLERDAEFYNASQRTSVGHIVNRAGYRIVRNVDLTGKRVLEIGPAAIEHIDFWTTKPKSWVNLDIREHLLAVAADRIEATGVPHEEVLVQPGSPTLPFPDGEFDAVFTFYALEHIYPLDPHLDEILRVLKPGGLLVGAIPCEGGLGWGMGRFVTTRRWLLKNTTIDPSRLICWEHPNFADFILNRLETKFERRRLRHWPLAVPSIDVNLVASFVFAKPGK